MTAPYRPRRRGRGTAEDLRRRLCDAVIAARPPETPVLLTPHLRSFGRFDPPDAHVPDAFDPLPWDR